MREDAQDPGTGPAEPPRTQGPPESPPPGPRTEREPFGTESVEEGEYSGDE